MRRSVSISVFLFLFALTATTPARAAYKGAVAFSAAEISQHRAIAARISDQAVLCLQADLSRQKKSIKDYGISAFYGDNSAFARLNAADKRKHLRSLMLPEILVQELVPSRDCESNTDCPLRMEPTSCIGLVMKCLGSGFEKAGQSALWSRIAAFTNANGVQGDALLIALQKLGWHVLYWNPDTSKAELWDEQEARYFPGNPKGVWGQHQKTWNSVRTGGPYWLNPVDDFRQLVDFGAASPAFLKKVPFFVGIAHIGYHVFPGSYGQIIEGHSTRAVTDPETIESSPFNPIQKNGGPRGGPYKSGLMAVPPGQLR